MNQQVSVSKTPLPIVVIGGLLIVPGIYSILFTILGLFAGGFSLTLTVPGILLMIIGIGVQKRKRWSLYAMVVILLATVLYVIQGLNNGLVMSVELLVLPAVTLLSTIYCWHKRALFS